MNYIVQFFSITFVLPSALAECQVAYGQCGGKQYEGLTCCEPGFECVRQNKWYSQCKVITDPSCTNTLYSKCGGRNFRGETCCPAGIPCVAHNAWYSQCEPGSANSGSTTPGGTTTTTTTPSPTTTTTGTTTTTTSASVTTSPPSPSTFNYAEVLGKSLTFYYGQMSGKISGTFNNLPWRGDSGLNDGSDKGVDLTGGFYDAGDHVKFGLPMSYSIYMLALSGINYENTYRATGQEWQRLLNIVKWGTDYFIKCHTAKFVFYGQVGRGDLDHSYWGPPETMTMSRPSFKITRSKPGSELAGSVAASFALASILFRNVDPSYSETLLQHGREMFEFATTFEGSYVDSINDARNYYNSFSGYKDEQLLGALALYWATNENQYRNYAVSNSRSLVGSTLTYAPNWDDASYVNLYLLSKLLGDNDAQIAFERWANFFMNDVRKTPQGMVYLSNWGSARFPVASGFLMLCYADSNPALSASKAAAYQSFAKSQIDYLLGNNNAGRSYLVGFGSNYPQHTHHRAAHGSTTNDINNPSVNKYVNYMLVGGPDVQDNYEDNIHNYSQSEGACDMQVGLVGLAAALVKRYGGQPLVNFP